MTTTINPLPDFPALMSISSVQAQGVGGRTQIYKLINEGKLESLTIGKARRITGRSLKALIQRLITEADQPKNPRHGGRPGEPRAGE